MEGVATPRLRLGADLNDYWVNSVLGEQHVAVPDLVSGAKRLRSAAEYFDGRIKALVAGVSVDEAARRLRDLQRRVTDGLRFLVYEVHDDAEVGVIFETLNERGRSLTELEKVKNYLLYLARQLPRAQQQDLAEFINKEWSGIFRRLSRLPARQEERLLRANWLATTNPDARQWQRTASVKERFPRSRYVPGADRLNGSEYFGTSVTLSDELYAEVKAYVQRLGACATFLAEMYDPAAEYHAFTDGRSRVRIATAALLRSPVVALFLPLIFAARLRFAADGSGYADLIELCERYSARVFAICTRRSNAGEPYLWNRAQAIQWRHDEQALADITALLLEYAPNDEVEENLRSPRHAWYWRQAHKYVLYEYERHLSRADQDVIAWEKLTDSGPRKTTEHILPQGPAEDSEWWTFFTPVQHQSLRHSLGNLMLTYDNSYYSNKDYAYKRGSVDLERCYFSPRALRQEQEVAQQWAKWTPETIIERQNRLTDWAMTRWSVERPRRAAASTWLRKRRPRQSSIRPTRRHKSRV